MSIVSEAVITSPISVGNVGGFDVGGMALEEPVNHYVVQQISSPFWNRGKVNVSYSGPHGKVLADLYRENPNAELVHQTAQMFMRRYPSDRAFTYNTLVVQEIPLRRGSGASAAARGSTWYTLNALNNAGLSDYGVIKAVAKLEGHWDNIAPNIYGGYVYILPEGEEDATLVRHLPIPQHGELLVIPPFEKQSTDVLRPPVQRFRADKTVLTSAVYRAGMVFRSTGSLDVSEQEVLNLAHDLTRDAPEDVPMPYVVEQMQNMVRSLYENHNRRGRMTSAERVATFGENSINDQTHIKARAEIRGYGPFDYVDWETLTSIIGRYGGYLRMSGAGPNHVIAFNRATMAEDALDKIKAQEKDFWRGLGYNPAELEFIRTRPAYNGTEIRHISRNGHQNHEITVTKETLEALLPSRY